MDLIIAIIIGAISGFIANYIMRGNGGLIKNTLIGVIGGFIGGFIFELLNISIAGYLGTIIISVIGSILLIYVVNKILK